MDVTDASFDDLVVDVRGLEVVGHDAPVLPQGGEEALEHVVQRHVVVAGDDHLRPGQRVEVGTRLAELTRAGALREVAGHHQHVGRHRHERTAQRLEEGGVDTPEVEVRDVGDGAQVTAPERRP